MKKIVIATKNQGKIKEFIQQFDTLPVEIHALSEYGDLPTAIEKGTTFADNALIKARFYAELTGCACLADDSGLAVTAFGGAPGVYSARYAGPDATDKDNNQKLVAELHRRGLSSSAAQYLCALVFYDTDATILSATGRCQGIIRDVPSGDGGFGYDPYFYVGTPERSMASLTLAEKNNLSHRGKAIKTMQQLLKEYLL